MSGLTFEDDDAGLAIPPGINEQLAAESRPAEPDQPAPRKRGRPSAADIAARQASMGAAPEIQIPGSENVAPKKRGRPAKKAAPEMLAKQLQGAHVMASMVFKAPELQIDGQEANMLAAALTGVAEQYDMTVDPKVAATMTLLATAAMIYLPRAAVISQRKKAERESAQIMGDQPTRETPPADGLAKQAVDIKSLSLVEQAAMAGG